MVTLQYATDARMVELGFKLNDSGEWMLSCLEPFAEWLLAQEQDDRIFNAGSIYSCPLAQWLQDELKQPVTVGMAVLHADTGVTLALLDSEPAHYAGAIDAGRVPGEMLTADQARAALPGQPRSREW